MIRNPLVTSLVASVSIAFVMGALPANSATTLKLTSCLQKNHDHVETLLQAYVKPVNAMKAGLKIRYLGGPEVTPRKKQASALKRGLVDMIFCPTPYYGGQLSEARLPGGHNKSLAELRKNGAWDMLETAWNKGLNAHILAFPAFKASTFYIYTKFKPVTNSKTGLDLTNRRMRSTGLYNDLLLAMNATPINMNPGDVYAGLERGVVDGLAWPKGSLAKYGWQRFLKYRIGPNFYGATQFLLINLDSHKKLSKAHKDLLARQSRIYEENSDPILEKKFVIDDRKLEEAGVKTIILKGAVGKAYLNTIYGAKWAKNDKQKYIVDYKKLKAKMYEPQ